MTAQKPSQVTAKDGRAARAARTRAVTCKTCTPCRQKKIKCDGTRPKCQDCEASGLACVYPRDARRELRASKTRIQSLEDTLSAVLAHMRESGIALPANLAIGEGEHFQGQGTPPPEHSPGSSTAAVHDSQSSLAAFSIPLPPPPERIGLTPISNPADPANYGTEHLDATLPETDRRPMSAHTPVTHMVGGGHDTGVESARQKEEDGAPGKGDNDSMTNALSPCEARVAGVFHEHGCVSSVHGLAGIMNPTSRERHKENLSKLTRRGETAIAESKARLISNAALQMQRETRLFRQPQDFMDLDGCNPGLAKHLIDLHFNRQHYAYLVTYRPTLMDSLANGGGPWVNKLLLNAMYYSGTLYSDRECLQSVPGDAQSGGSHFYNRFRQLLVNEMQKPSIPSAAALLLMSAALVSRGHSSAGWSLSGTAYRMILDLGCHMMLGPDYQSTAGLGSGRKLRRDLEQEMRKRLYWGAYVTDATQSLYLGRPCMFASVEARVPLQPLDTFEELEDWQPYIDPIVPSPTQPPYAPQPAHAVSTFMALARLLQISTRITDLYGIQSIRLGTEAQVDRKRSIEWELESWKNNLPAHLQFDPDGSYIPPPHQITPHTTFYALTILLHRAFLDQGHLHRHSNEASKRVGEETCVRSALMIEKYVRAYRNAFTLRRAPFLLSYAIYSAATAILQQESDGRDKFTEQISFFWTCLNELQRGCNFGLKKPLAILQDMVHELQCRVNEGNLAEPWQQLQPRINDSMFLRLFDGQNIQGVAAQTVEASGPSITTPDHGNAVDQFDPTCGAMATDMMDFLNDQEKDIWQDSLYGLFAPSPHLP